MQKNLGFILWTISCIALFFYSFTQIDLGLTFSRASIFLDIERSFQYVGFFNRPLSSVIFIAILILFCISNILLLRQARDGKLLRSHIWKLIGVSVVILFFSYNAFSYDLFNYIFDAKIVTHYHQNPYQHKALDYPQDPMLSFMRWTHREYPYGPVWLGLSIPLSYLGMGYFIVTFYLFKALMAASFVGAACMVEKIMQKINPKYSLFALVFFAFNPLVIVESLVSAHNDIVMLFLGLVALYMLVQKSVFKSGILYLLSVGIKFATVFMAPIYLLLLPKFHKKYELVFQILFYFMIIPVILATLRSNFQPWYFLYVVPFASFLVYKKYIAQPVWDFSISCVFYYVFYIYNGHGEKLLSYYQNGFIAGSTIGVLVVSSILYYRSRQNA